MANSVEFDAAAFLTSRDFCVDKNNFGAREFVPSEYESRHRSCDYFPRSPYPLPRQFRPSPSLSATIDVPDNTSKPAPTEFVAARASSLLYDLMTEYMRFQSSIASREESLEAMDALLKLSEAAPMSEDLHFPKVCPLDVFEPAYESNERLLSAMRETLDNTGEIPEIDAADIAEKEVEVKEPNTFDISKLSGDDDSRSPLREMLAALAGRR